MNCHITSGPPQPDDHATLASLCHDLGYPVDALQLAARLARIEAHPEHQLFLARNTKRIIGWVHLAQTLRITSDPYVEICGLVVDPAYRDQGIGRQLIIRSRHWSAKRGIDQLRVRCQEQRTDAHRFYRSVGFTEIKQQRIFSLRLIT